MSVPVPTKAETADALYEAGVIVDILKNLGKAANAEAVCFTGVDFLVELLDERLDLIGEAARAAGAA
jgi:hypothetical protein